MKNKRNDNERPRSRFSKKKYGEIIMRLFHLMPTAELARMLRLLPRQVSDFAYRNNYEKSLAKDAKERTKVASENGKKGGRPRRKS